MDMRADGAANPTGCVWKNAVYAISTQVRKTLGQLQLFPAAFLQKCMG
jgi:hypothetical protein